MAKKKVTKKSTTRDFKARLKAKLDKMMTALEKELDEGSFRRGEDLEVQIELEMCQIFYDMIDKTR